MNYEINERFKSVRKALDLTQSEFSETIGFSQSSITMIERKSREVQDRHIKAVCLSYNVNEHWLRTGEGEMFDNISTDAEVAKFAGEILSGGTTLEKCFIACLARTTPEERAILAKIMMDTVHMYDEQKAAEDEKQNKANQEEI